MATAGRKVYYREGDGKPIAETPLHRDVLLGMVDLLARHFAHDPSVYVSGNMMMYYVEGDPKKHLSPDVFMARGIGNRYRHIFKVWEEDHGPDVVIEITSPSTRKVDLEHKHGLYQDVLKVCEYFLFDPLGEYLKPPLRGFRLVEGCYEPIAVVEGRLPSEVLGFHLERVGNQLRLFDPQTGRWLPTPREEVAARDAALAEKDATLAQKDEALAEKDEALAEKDEAMEEVEAENERLRRELEELRRRLGGA